jgi:hypothetical protein
MDFATIAKLLGESPELNKAFSYENMITYIDLIRLLKPYLRCLSHNDLALERLPLATHDFLKLCLNLEDETAKLAWHPFATSREGE